MADLRSSFPTLEDSGTGAGIPLTAMQSGDDPSGAYGSLAFAFRDSSGNVILPQLDASGRLPVTQQAAGTCLTGTAKVAGSGSEVTVLEISLAAGESYAEIDALVACFRDASFRLVHVDDPSGSPVITDLAHMIVGPGDLAEDFNQGCMEFTAGSTSPVLRVLGQNINSSSDMRATVSLLQKA